MIAALRRDDRNVGYAVYRHFGEPRGRVTSLVDFLVDYSWRSDTSIAAAIEAHTEPLPETALHPLGQPAVTA